LNLQTLVPKTNALTITPYPFCYYISHRVTKYITFNIKLGFIKKQQTKSIEKDKQISKPLLESLLNNI
jgi:hypothetical protein